MRNGTTKSVLTGSNPSVMELLLAGAVVSAQSKKTQHLPYGRTPLVCSQQLSFGISFSFLANFQLSPYYPYRRHPKLIGHIKATKKKYYELSPYINFDHLQMPRLKCKLESYSRNFMFRCRFSTIC